MQDKFYHEKLVESKEPQMRVFKAISELRIIATQLLFEENGREFRSGIQRLPDSILPLVYLHAKPIFHKYGLPFEPAMSMYERFSGEFNTNIFSVINDIIMKNYNSFHSYVFAECFLPVLLRAKIDNISWNMLKKDIFATVRFPHPIRDTDGEHISEVTMVIGDNEIAEKSCFKNEEEYAHDKSILMSCISAEGSILTLNFGIMKDSSLSIRETLSRKGGRNTDFWMNIFKTVVYLSSGDPDLRDEKNPIKYQSKTSQTPIKDHKKYSQLPYKVVGWNWQKQPLYTKDSWSVEPFLRFQPCGKGRSDYKIVLVKEHIRSRRQDIESSESTQSV